MDKNVCEEVLKKIDEEGIIFLSPLQNGLLASLKRRDVGKDVPLINFIDELKPYFHRKYRNITPANLLKKKHNQIYAARIELNKRIQKHPIYKDFLYVALGSIRGNFKLLAYPDDFTEAKAKDNKKKSTPSEHKKGHDNLNSYLKSKEFSNFEKELGVKFNQFFDYKNPEFERIREISLEQRKEKFHDKQYYMGVDCTWHHIYSEQDILRPEWISKVFRNLADKGRHCFIKGDLGQGKSTLMKRVAYKYHDIFEVFEINENVVITEETLYFMLSILRKLSSNSSKRILLIVENFLTKNNWEFLLEKILDLENIYLLAANRERDWDEVKTSKLNTKITYINLELDYKSAENIYKNLQKNDKILTKETWWRIYERSGKKMMEFVTLLSQGEHLKILLQREIDNLSKSFPEGWNILRYISTSHTYLNMPLTYKMLKNLTGFDDNKLAHTIGSLIDVFIRENEKGYIGIHEMRSQVCTEIIHQHLPIESTISEIILHSGNEEQLKNISNKSKIYSLTRFLMEFREILTDEEATKIMKWCKEPLGKEEIKCIVKKVDCFAKKGDIKVMLSILRLCGEGNIRDEIKNSILSVIIPRITLYFSKFNHKKEKNYKFWISAAFVLSTLKDLNGEYFLNLVALLSRHYVVRKATDSINRKQWQEYLQKSGLSSRKGDYSPWVGVAVTVFLVLSDKKLITYSIIKKIIEQTEMMDRGLLSLECISLFPIIENVLSKNAISKFKDEIIQQLLKELSKEGYNREGTIRDLIMFHKEIAEKLCDKLGLDIEKVKNPLSEIINRSASEDKNNFEETARPKLKAIFNCSIPKIYQQFIDYKKWKDEKNWMVFFKNIGDIRQSITEALFDKNRTPEINSWSCQHLEEYFKYASAGMWWDIFNDMEKETKEMLGKKIINLDEKSIWELQFIVQLEFCISLIKHCADEADYCEYICTFVGKDHLQYFKYFYDSVKEKELLVEKCKIDYPDIFQ